MIGFGFPKWIAVALTLTALKTRTTTALSSGFLVIPGPIMAG
jgi:hypothetical protein